jgi:PAS domain S-box-containing protein
MVDTAGTDRFEALARASSGAVFRMNADWSALLSLEGGDLIAAPSYPDTDYLDRYAIPEDRPAVEAAIREAVAGCAPFELEHRVHRADGTIGWTWSRAVPVFAADGSIAEWIGMATDISARKAAERELAQQRRLYEAILTNTPDLAHVWDRSHRFIYANEGLLRMWGKTWDEVIGRTCLELGYEPWHAELHDREIEQVVATRRPVRGEVPYTGTFGRRIYDYLLVPVIGADGEVEAVAGTTRDVTESKQLQASLLEADQRKDEFLATLAHELRNPLAPIRNAVRLLKSQQLDPGQVQGVYDMIERQTTHLVRLVDDLMDVSRITRGQINLQRSRVSPRRVVTDAVEAAMPALEARGHALSMDLPADLPAVEGDATRLAQVFQNLLDNAAKYTPPGGRISISAKVGSEAVAITVADNGNGIEPDHQVRVFELFGRGADGDTMKISGLGIGLALARQLVRLHRGDITVHSEGRGRGSVFTVRLPVAGAQ